MDNFESGNEFEKYLRQKSAQALTPFSGGLELLPDCNMNCRFCYVHQNNNRRVEKGEILSAEEWIGIINQAYDMGLYSLLVTGGEPLLYPEFKKLFAWMSEKGLILTLNTNGTLFDESWIDFFKNYGVRQFNVTLYGTDNETYEKLCGFKNGYSKVMNTLRLMKEAGFHFRISVSVVPENMHQLERMKEIANELDVAISYATYMFPASRKEINPEEQYRMKPEEAAEAAIRCYHLQYPHVDYEATCRYSLSKLAAPQRFNHVEGFVCYAGKSDFWLSWNGQMRVCGMFSMPELSYNLKEKSFAECWQSLVEDSHKLHSVCRECSECKMRDLCQSCPAINYAESRQLDGKPEYQCRMTKHMVNFLFSEVERLDKEYGRIGKNETNISEELKTDHTTASIGTMTEDTNLSDNDNIANIANLPKVSIIVPVYNVCSYLARCIDAILSQALQEFELILVDDGSTDGSSDICDHYAALDSRIKVIHQENQGVSVARNVGIEHAKASYILFVDSDDYPESTWASSLYNKILAQPDALVMTNVWTGNEDAHRKLTIHEDFPDYDHIPLNECERIIVFAYVWNKIYRKDFLEHVRFDENISYEEDYIFNLEYMKLCKEAVFIPSPQYVHLTHESGLAIQGLAKKGKKLSDVELSQFLGELKLVRRF